jgi:mannan endo-1,4-beta-mannosidase
MFDKDNSKQRTKQWAWVARIMLAAVLFAILILQSVAPRNALASSNNSLLGIYHGNQGWKMSDVAAMEQWQGKKNAVVVLFTNWCNRSKDMNNLFGQQLVNIWNNGNVPMITWEPHLCTARNTPNDIEVRAANGEYDAYFNAWADRLKTWLSGPDGVFGTADDRRAYIRMGHEMNGDWYQWGASMGNNHPSDFVNMWIRIHGIFASKGLGPSHIQWVWSPNHVDCLDWACPGGYPAESYYPGSQYVDWIGIDGYNWGTSQSWSSWQSPDQIYGNMLNRLRTLDNSKPIVFAEFASSSSGGNKGAWITDVFNYALTNDIRMVTWFNEDKETDWAVYGGSTVWNEYKIAVGSAAFLPSDASNPRLLTNDQFAGILTGGSNPTPVPTATLIFTPTPGSGDPTPTPSPTPGGGGSDTMHISSMTATINGKANWQSAVTVSVVDGSGNPVGSATVTGEWSGLVSGGDNSKVTNSSGIAGPFYSNRTTQTGVITFCVTSISKNGMTYNPNANSQTCISVSK